MSREDWKRPEKFSAPEGRRRVAMELAYDGRAYVGWQTQDSGVSVQETLKHAVEKLIGQKNVEICGSGRTDSGVHAFGQVAHAEFDDCSIPVKAFCSGLNAFLPVSIRIKKAWDCGPDFHSRYSAMAREYRYFCMASEGKDAFSDGLVTCYRKLPDIQLLNSYAKCIIGTHDFTTFACSKDICPSKVRDIYESEFFVTTSTYNQKLLCYKVCGNAFLYHMVRSLVGTMIELGNRNAGVDEFEKILNSQDRSKVGKTAPSDGLYLWRVSYDPEEYSWFEEQYGRK